MPDEFEEIRGRLTYTAEAARDELRKLTAHAMRIAADLTAALPEQYQAAGYRFEFHAPAGIPALDSATRLYRGELGQRDERRGEIEGTFRDGSSWKL